jgi:hypothetical protein
MDLVRLNLRTAKVSIEKSYLFPAAEYMRKAIVILEQEQCNTWIDDYEPCLDVYGTAAEIEYSMGNVDASMRLVDIIRERATCSKDTLSVNFTTLNSLGNQGELNLALDLDLALDLLLELGVKLPRNPRAGQGLRELARMKLRLLGWSYDDLAALPRMENEEAKAAIVILNQACLFGWFLRDESW